MSIDDMKDKLNIFINLYGTLDPRTIRISQELDIIIVKEMREKYGRKHN